jgi:hypothetical protein
MAYGIITMRKISGKTYGIQSHIYRQHESRSNPDIDRDRSAENYSILDEYKGENVERLVKDRIESLPKGKTKNGKPKTIRKNAVRLCDFVVTVSPEVMQDLDKDQRDGYFRDCLYWLEERYGKENIAYAQVHMDEANPHLHIGVIPIRDNELNCKAIFNPKEMKGLQEGFYNEIASYYGLEKPVGGVKGLETLRYKAKQAQQELTNSKGFYEGAPKRVKGYLRDAIKTCIGNDLKSKNEYARDAAASFRYIKEHGDESWKNDWDWMTEMEKDEKRMKAAYREDDY